jgi:phage terminase large subunit-like protein
MNASRRGFLSALAASAAGPPLVSALIQLPETDADQVLSKLTDDEATGLLYDWHAWARENQLIPDGDWSTWLVLAGRGFGKTRTGAETVREWSDDNPLIALVGPTASDVRDIMIEGESGILACSPSWNWPHYEPSKRRVEWPNGSRAIAYSADEPDRLRGPQHHKAWGDELASWKHVEAWDNLQMTMRLGTKPQTVVTTTPRPKKLIRDLKKDPTTHVTAGSTYDNRGNVSQVWLKQILKKYEGTRLGRQELYAEILDDAPGALWTRQLIEKCRRDTHPDLRLIIIAIDPAVTANEESDDTGIIVIGLGVDGHGYVLRDLTCHLPATGPEGWAARAVNAYKFYKANYIIGEVNNGGDLVEGVIKQIDPRVVYRGVRASRGKFVRAEPVAQLYEQGRMHHVRRPESAREFDTLEDQMCQFVPGNLDGSPDNMDALVWGASALFVEPEETRQVVVYEDRVRISPF